MLSGGAPAPRKKWKSLGGTFDQDTQRIFRMDPRVADFASGGDALDGAAEAQEANACARWGWASHDAALRRQRGRPFRKRRAGTRLGRRRERTSFDSGSDGGSADITIIGLFEVIKSAAQGAGLIGISSNFNVYPQTLTLTNDAIAKAGITPKMHIDEKIKRLQGMRIGISSPGSTTDALIRTVLLARGFDPDKYVTLQPLGGDNALYAAFKQKAIDGFVWTAPVPQMAMVEKLGQIVVDPLTGEAPEFKDVIFSVMVASRDAIKSKPDVLRGRSGQ